MLITWMVSVVDTKSRTFPVSHILVLSRWAGAGREHKQAESQDGQRKYFRPWAARVVCEWGLAGGQEPVISLSQEFEFFLVWEFKLFHELGLFSGILQNP